MGDHSHGSPQESGTVAKAQDDSLDKIQDPGLPPHRARLTDTDPRAAKRAERQVAILFAISMIGTVLFFVGYFAVGHPESIAEIRLQNMLLGSGTAFAMLGIGVGIVHWARTLMPDHEIAESRHEVRTEEGRQEAEEIVNTIVDESGISRRPLIRNSLIGALALAPLPGIVILRDLDLTKASASEIVDRLRHTMWDKGVRLTRDPSGTPIKASDVQIGSAFHVIPDGLNETEDPLNEKAKAVVLLMRLNPEDLNVSPEREDWHHDGIVAYSKICTHVGCPVALYEQHTHHLLCPCHQSTFDLTQECEVIFGPAAHALPQLPITVDADGFLVAQSDFHEPVGPGYWERP
ncbi:cytochrome bc1 complex Rieske iron-sulfur subunit [Zhihengliuella salsuginis]|uniref:Cytochrome bc1 complex Rieske iron-sulfur subunit n=1 Tax=Zhihengliuella salsuginis TaxID=578222 RepID=A0ABQ3GLP9_9MICC|nr:Rieske 2Fe-2S domain-containing protein [Zhihengliuella salsuginis]GHD12617.1 cytochrome bc1 complex Rieske iron-sulfur subunit [Zhihengliuella salsuginis]